jgi:hypothetical protein
MQITPEKLKEVEDSIRKHAAELVEKYIVNLRGYVANGSYDSAGDDFDFIEEFDECFFM